MREILFRAKIKTDNAQYKTGDWVQGDYVRLKDGNRLIPHIYGKGEVIENTVGQYTGLTDKNGTKIFEGDVVKIGSEIIKWKSYHKVVFEEGQWFYLHEEISTKSYMGAWGNSCVEVIGNIHDNPELLGGVNK